MGGQFKRIVREQRCFKYWFHFSPISKSVAKQLPHSSTFFWSFSSNLCLNRIIFQGLFIISVSHSSLRPFEQSCTISAQFEVTKIYGTSEDITTSVAKRFFGAGSLTAPPHEGKGDLSMLWLLCRSESPVTSWIKSDFAGSNPRGFNINVLIRLFGHSSSYFWINHGLELEVQIYTEQKQLLLHPSTQPYSAAFLTFSIRDKLLNQFLRL